MAQFAGLSRLQRLAGMELLRALRQDIQSTDLKATLGDFPQLTVT